MYERHLSIVEERFNVLIETYQYTEASLLADLIIKIKTIQVMDKSLIALKKLEEEEI